MKTTPIDNIKLQFIAPKLQVLICSLNGFIVESCDTLFSTENYREKSIFEYIPLLKNLVKEMQHISDGITKKFPKQSFQFNNETYQLNVYVQKTSTNWYFYLEKDKQNPAYTINDKTAASSSGNSLSELDQLRKQMEIHQQFFAQIAHDIKLPLTEIIGNTFLLQHFVHDAKGKQYLKTLADATRGLDNMLNDLLQLSRNQLSHFKFNDQYFSPKTVLDSLLTSFAFKSQQKNIPIELHTDPQLPENVNGDPMRLSQILYNLIDNALKFTSKGKIMLNAQVQKNTADKCYLEFSVKDTGMGIPAENLQSIFETFKQLQNLSGAQSGYGIGLSIVKQLVELQGGSIHANSQPNKGSEFVFCLPYKSVAVPSA
ncbi:MAG: HAMP domain-containing sensor histidine kinase [Chitinophagales bacterium]|nr:HAMP domain-containing histidine kinase [Bacteroidota bacterium]MCB9042727.1 HAMP domain-containing histidine kinase [Chitinophagales bacterium]